MATLAILVSDKNGFETRNITWDKESNFIMTGSTYQQDKTIIDVHTPNTRANNTWSKRVEERKGDIDDWTIVEVLIPIPSNGKNNWTENQQGYRRLEKHYQPTWPNWHL